MDSQPAQTSTSPLRWIAFIIIVLVLGAAGFAAVRNNPNSNRQNNQTQGPNPSGTQTPLAAKTVVYGSWTGTNTEISATDLTTLNVSVIASLPLSIKKVSVLSPNTLMYINETNMSDHGKEIVTYDIKSKKVLTKISADNGFGVDDYILSPNKKYLAVWEVSFAQDSGVLQGGRSRVYAVDLTNPSEKHLIYDEVASPTTPIHQPRSILNDGKVFTDKFIPNCPEVNCWAYGLSVSDFDGNNKKDVDSMSEGTYGTQPFLSPDGKTLVFAGYDGSLGDGKTAVPPAGSRRALLTPNTVELLDTSTLQRRKLPNLPNTNVYNNVYWDNISDNLIVTILSRKEEENGLFLYSPTSGSLKNVTLPEDSEKPFTFVGNLSSTMSLVGIADDSRSSLANLGEEYAASISNLYVQDSASGNMYNIRLNNTLVQHITILPVNYFSSILGIAHAQGGNPAHPNVTVIDLYSDKPSQENLQLKTFMLKPELAPVREKQQSTPVRPRFDFPKTISCRDLATEQCLALGYEENSRAFRNCHQKAWDANRATKGTPEAVCNKSPLYVYGTPGQQLNVGVQTPIYNDFPSYNGKYNITVLDDEGMEVNGERYESIQFDYRSNLKKITMPTKGTVAAKSGVEKVLREYAKKLGLNEKETNDLVASGRNKVTSPYVFISFFDHETSSRILPLSFSPKPDNYLNVVFYFKLLDKEPNFSVAPPEFGKPISRDGLTAVEISEIVE